MVLKKDKFISPTDCLILSCPWTREWLIDLSKFLPYHRPPISSILAQGEVNFHWIYTHFFIFKNSNMVVMVIKEELSPHILYKQMRNTKKTCQSFFWLFPGDTFMIFHFLTFMRTLFFPKQRSSLTTTWIRDTGVRQIPKALHISISGLLAFQFFFCQCRYSV